MEKTLLITGFVNFRSFMPWVNPLSYSVMDDFSQALCKYRKCNLITAEKRHFFFNLKEEYQ